MKIYSL